MISENKINKYVELVKAIQASEDWESVEHIESAADYAWSSMNREERKAAKEKLRTNEHSKEEAHD